MSTGRNHHRGSGPRGSARAQGEGKGEAPVSPHDENPTCARCMALQSEKEYLSQQLVAYLDARRQAAAAFWAQTRVPILEQEISRLRQELRDLGSPPPPPP